MIQQQLFLDDTIYRFELKTNSAPKAYEKAFNLYGILIIPTLIGGVLMYNIFQLREEYFAIAFLLLILLLGNLYFYYQKINHYATTIRLLIQNDKLQILDNHQIYFEDSLENTMTEIILCGKTLQPALKLESNDFKSIIIGLKSSKMNQPVITTNQLNQPDYWLFNRQQSDLLIDLMNKKNFPMTE